MPRYFFHRTNGFVDHDDEGTELEDLRVARIEAIRFAGVSLQEEPDNLRGHAFRIEVTDETGAIVFSVVTQAFHSAASAKILDPEDPTPWV